MSVRGQTAGLSSASGGLPLLNVSAPLEPHPSPGFSGACTLPALGRGVNAMGSPAVRRRSEEMPSLAPMQRQGSALEAESTEAYELMQWSKICATKLTAYLEEHPDAADSPAALARFEEFTKGAVLRAQISVGSRLHDALCESGWDGARFRDADAHVFRAVLTSKLSLLCALYSKEEATYNRSNKGNLIKSFCPTLLLESLVKLASRRTATLVPHRLDFTGVCMLADISGFTALAARYTAEGPAGLDSLHGTTKDFLGKFVQQVYAHDGDVIAFAGDALICTFVNRGVDARLCCMDALRCAYELRELHNEFLSVHTALSYGDMSMGCLGGHNDSWIYLLNGACLAEIADCIHDAASGEVVMTRALHENMSEELLGGEVLECEPTASGNVRLLRLDVRDTFRTHEDSNRFAPFQDSGLLIRLSERFVPKPVVDGLALFKEIGERRLVATLFLNLDSYSLDLHLDPVSLQPFFLMAQKELADSGGFMRQFLVDDKGCVLIGMWGVPCFMHANIALNALRCAASVHSLSGDLGHRCSIGITTGSVYCGTVGSFLRHDYVGIGGTVNLAARLMSVAQGRILLDTASADLLPKEHRDQLSDLPVRVKGYAEELTAYEYRGGVVSAGRGERVARDVFEVVRRVVAETLQGLLVAFKASPEGGGEYIDNAARLFASPGRESQARDAYSLCIVEGEGGMGRSSAASFFVGAASKLHLKCIHISARHDDEAYGVFIKLFVDLVGPEKFKSEAGQREVLGKLLRAVLPPQRQLEEFDEVMSRLRAFLKLQWKGDSDSFRATLLQAPEDVVEDTVTKFEWIVHKLLNDRKRVVVIEDAQFCDELTWKRLGNILTSHLPVLMLVTVHVDPHVASGAASSRANPSTQVGAAYNVSSDTQLKQQLLHSSTYTEIGASDKCKTIVLSALTEGDITSMLESILEKSLVKDELVRTVFDISKGNPFWITTIAEFVKEKGSEALQNAIRSSEKGEPSRRASDSNNPLRSLILCKLDALSNDLVHVAKTASIIGDEFSEALLQLLLPDVRSVGDKLRALKEKEFIDSVSLDPDTYEFKNPLLRTVIYSLIPYTITSEFHLKIARHYEDTYAANLSPYFTTLSYHFARVKGMRTNASKYASRSADERIKHGAYGEGLVLVERAKTLAQGIVELKRLKRSVDVGLASIGRGSRMTSIFSSPQTVPEMDAYRQLREDLVQRIREVAAPAPASVALPALEITASPASPSRASATADRPAGTDRQTNTMEGSIVLATNSNPPQEPSADERREGARSSTCVLM